MHGQGTQNDIASQRCPLPSRNSWHAGCLFFPLCFIEARSCCAVAANGSLGYYRRWTPAFLVNEPFDAFASIMKIYCARLALGVLASTAHSQGGGWEHPFNRRHCVVHEFRSEQLASKTLVCYFTASSLPNLKSLLCNERVV